MIKILLCTCLILLVGCGNLQPQRCYTITTIAGITTQQTATSANAMNGGARELKLFQDRRGLDTTELVGVFYGVISVTSVEGPCKCEESNEYLPD